MLKWFVFFTLGFPRVVYSSIVLKYMLKHKDKYPLEVRYNVARKTAKWLCFLTRRRGNILNKEIINESHKGRVYVSNHFSKFDSVEMIELSDKPIIILSKYENMKASFLSSHIKGMDGLFLKRDDPRQSIKMCNEAIEKINQGYDVVIYAEGTRSKSGNIEEFKGAVSYIVRKAKCDVVLVCVHNTTNPFKTRYLKYPIEPFNIWFSNPITYDNYKNNKETFINDIRNIMIEKLNEFKAQNKKPS